MYSVLRRRSWVIVLVVGLALLALPASVGAASTTGNLVDQTELVTVQEPVNPVFAIPGLFALTSEGLDLPALNATSKLNGLNFNNGLGFDTLTVNQKQPLVNPGYSLSDLQATVAGPAKGYSTNLTGHVEIGTANAPLQAKATVGALYDAVGGRSGVSVQDGSANLAAGPVNVALSGVNTGQGNIGFDALTVSQSQPLVSPGFSLSDLQATVAGAAQAYTSNLSGHVALGSANGPFQAAATLGAVYDIANGKAGVSVQDGSANLAAGPVSVALSGVKTGQGTLGFDALTVSQSQPLVSQGLTLSGLQATVAGADKALRAT